MKVEIPKMPKLYILYGMRCINEDLIHDKKTESILHLYATRELMLTGNFINTCYSETLDLQPQIQMQDLLREL